MAFYGNDLKESRFQFHFDKIYPNKKEMDTHVADDGIYINRYVLVKYTESSSAVIRQGTLAENGVNVSGSPTEPGQYIVVDDRGKKDIYLVEEGPESTKLYTLCKSGTTAEDINFNVNLSIDGYQNYDATVWEKRAENGDIHYVKVADLNSKAPTISITTEAPTHIPLSVHEAEDSNSNHVKYHAQNPWGFRVKVADNIQIPKISTDGTAIQEKEYPEACKFEAEKEYYYRTNDSESFTKLNNGDSVRLNASYYVPIAAGDLSDQQKNDYVQINDDYYINPESPAVISPEFGPLYIYGYDDELSYSSVNDEYLKADDYFIKNSDNNTYEKAFTIVGGEKYYTGIYDEEKDTYTYTGVDKISNSNSSKSIIYYIYKPGPAIDEAFTVQKGTIYYHRSLVHALSDTYYDDKDIQFFTQRLNADFTNISSVSNTQKSDENITLELKEDNGTTKNLVVVNENDKTYTWAEDQTAAELPAAIFYNKAGFEVDTENKIDKPVDFISVTPTGYSGKLYQNHDGTYDIAPDVQELSINLPSLGNAVAEMWNIVYGAGEENGKRNKDIAWNSTNGNRAIINEDGYSFNPDKLSTLAGCINSVHDLMGMIIIDNDDPILTYDIKEDVNSTNFNDFTLYKIVNGEYILAESFEENINYYIQLLEKDYSKAIDNIIYNPNDENEKFYYVAKLGNGYELKPLVGFARNFNTIHGIILHYWQNIVGNEDDENVNDNTFAGLSKKVSDLLNRFSGLDAEGILYSNGDEIIRVSLFTGGNKISTSFLPRPSEDNDETSTNQIRIDHESIGKDINISFEEEYYDFSATSIPQNNEYIEISNPGKIYYYYIPDGSGGYKPAYQFPTNGTHIFEYIVELSDYSDIFSNLETYTISTVEYYPEKIKLVTSTGEIYWTDRNVDLYVEDTSKPSGYRSLADKDSNIQYYQKKPKPCNEIITYTPKFDIYGHIEELTRNHYNLGDANGMQFTTQIGDRYNAAAAAGGIPTDANKTVEWLFNRVAYLESILAQVIDKAIFTDEVYFDSTVSTVDISTKVPTYAAYDAVVLNEFGSGAFNQTAAAMMASESYSGLNIADGVGMNEFNKNGTTPYDHSNDPEGEIIADGLNLNL